MSTVEQQPPLDAPAPPEGADGRASGRGSKWDRPRPPRDWRDWVGDVGKVLIAVGVLMFGFVAYQLWGTGIETARAQNRLESEFTDLLAETGAVDPGAPATTTPDPSPDPDPTTGPVPDGVPRTPPVPAADQNLPPAEDGDAIARIEIPRLGVDDIVVAGVDPSDLKKGPGHYPDTPLPGQLGNAAIAGHRTTYGQPFHDVDDLQVGDEIVVTTLSGRFVYTVSADPFIVSPSDYEVVATSDPTRAQLTLTSCHPKWTARERIIVTALLDTERSGPVGEPTLNYGRPARVTEAPPAAGPTTTVSPDPDPATGAPPSTLPSTAAFADAFASGWFSDPDAWPHVAGWGLLLALIGLAAHALSRRVRRDLVGLAVGILPFLVTAYFFFENVNRLLPPNL